MSQKLSSAPEMQICQKSGTDKMQQEMVSDKEGSENNQEIGNCQNHHCSGEKKIVKL